MTRFDLNTVPVKDIWYQISVYAPDQVPTILDAFAKWQESEPFDVKSTVAMVINLQTVTLGLIYSAPAEKPAAFAPFYDIPSVAVPVPGANSTVLALTQILGSTFSNTPQR